MAVTLHITADPTIPGVTRISGDPSWPRPHIGILGAIHGNEPCGLEAFRRLEFRARAGTLNLTHGTLVLVHGNPAATSARRRHTDAGEDLNRILDFTFETGMPTESWGTEHRRAQELRPLLESLDTMLDLHSATSETPPFAIVNAVPQSMGLARRLGVDLVAHAWGDVSYRVTIGIPARLGRPGLSVECGRHDAPETFDVAVDVAERFLSAVGVMEGDAPERPVRVVHVEGILKKPSESFSFSQRLTGLSWLEEGTLIGSDGAETMRVPWDCWALLPNDSVAVGEDMLYLAREESHQ